MCDLPFNAMRQSLFTNREQDAFFKAKGYCTAAAFLNQPQMQRLLQIYNDNMDYDDMPLQFFTTHWLSSEAARLQIHRDVQAVLHPLVKNLLPGYKSLLGYYLVKKPGGANPCILHQDWAMTDESRFTGITLWCPLTDVTGENGNFAVVEGSHRFFHNPRGTNLDMPFDRFAVSDIEKKFLTHLPVKAGDAIFFDHRLIHASPPNMTSQIRVAVGMVMIPEEAPVIHHLHQGDKLLVYEADDNFLLSFYYNWREPEKPLFNAQNYKLVDTRDYSMPAARFEEFEQYVAKAGK